MEHRSVLLRSTTPDTGDQHDVQDAVLNTMQSFRFLQEKLGLAKHILQQTAEFLSLTTNNVYSPLRYTHTGDPTLIPTHTAVTIA